MKKYKLIIGILIVLLIVFCAALWKQKAAAQAERASMETLCQHSAREALESFKNYKASGENFYYISGVAEYHSFITNYRFLNNDDVGERMWSNTIYGYMIRQPEKVQNNLEGLIEALEYLAEDYDSPNGFNKINVYSNRLSFDGD